MKQWKTALVFVLAALTVCIAYFSELDENPPAYFIDEASIAYNAWTIASTGVDEHGERFPLFFKAFGEYKNPVYIYALAGFFKLAPPRNEVPRAFSAAAGVITAILLGWLAFLISRQSWIGIVVMLFSAATPLLFELSRLVYEVALFPLVTTLFLLAAWRASRQKKWTVATVAALIVTLTLLTFTYSTGRMLGPLFAAGLLLFITRPRVPGLIATLIGYTVIAIVPLILYSRAQPEFNDRFRAITYIYDDRPVASIAAEFLGHYVTNLNPVKLAREGDFEPKHHLPGSGGSLLAGILVLAAGGLVLTLVKESRWWGFVFYCFVASVIPASLTRENLHSLRLSALPVLLFLLIVPALERKSWRVFVVIALLGAAWQAAYFARAFHGSGWKRAKDFHADYRILFHRLAESDRRPIIIPPDQYIYVWGLWYGVAANAEVRLNPDPVPPDGVIIGPLVNANRDHLIDAESRYAAWKP